MARKIAWVYPYKPVKGLGGTDVDNQKSKKVKKYESIKVQKYESEGVPSI